jgi:cobaltochelatase CobN
MAHVLPTGRNFYNVDPRALPTNAAWTVGQALARDAIERHTAETGAPPENIALSVWGTATMRTGGDEIAQALALIGARPLWNAGTRRAAGFEIIPLAELARPRIDVTLRVSGFFRDAFPQLMHLFDTAARAVAALDEPPAQNHLRAHWLADTATLVGEGIAPPDARRRAAHRVFSSKPGAYGTGLLDLIETHNWRDTDDLARAFLAWGGWAYGADTPAGAEATADFRRRLGATDLALHNQDNREHDLFDSDDYFQFQGGLIAAIAALSGRPPRAYFGDTSDPARPVNRTLQAEALRVHRTRVTNPKWLAAIRRHGYKGGLEMAATVDYMFGYSATTGVITGWMYEDVAENYTKGETRDFLRRSNPWALHAIAERMLEAHQRGLWNAHPETLAHLRETLLSTEATLESAT